MKDKPIKYSPKMLTRIPFKDADPQKALDRAYQLSSVALLDPKKKSDVDTNLGRDYLNVNCLASEAIHESNRLKKEMKKLLKLKKLCLSWATSGAGKEADVAVSNLQSFIVDNYIETEK